MKMVMIVYNHSIDDEMLELLAQCKVAGYTHIEHATGSGINGPHMGTNVWPATNNVVFSCVDDAAKVKALLAGVQELSARFPGEGARAFTWKIEEAV